MSYTINDGIPIPLKQRSLKHRWDIDVVKTAVALRGTNYSCNFIVEELLKKRLSDDELVDIETHKRRIIRRLKLMHECLA